MLKVCASSSYKDQTKIKKIHGSMLETVLLGLAFS